MDPRALLDKIIKDGEAGEATTQRAFAFPRLRPYMPTRRLLWRLVLGMIILARMALRAAHAGLRHAIAPKPAKPQAKPQNEAKTTDGAKTKEDPAKKTKPTLADAAERIVAGALAVLIACVTAIGIIRAAAPHLRPYAPILVSTAAAALIAAAWAVAPAPPRPAAPQAARTDAPDLDAAEGRRLAFLQWLEKTTRGASGIHLGEIHRQLTLLPATKGMPRHHVRPLLDHYGIPVQRTLRVGRIAGRSGVARQAILDALSAPPPIAETNRVEPAGDQHRPA